MFGIQYFSRIWVDVPSALQYILPEAPILNKVFPLEYVTLSLRPVFFGQSLSSM